MSEKLTTSIRYAGEIFEIHDPHVEDREPGFEHDGLSDEDTHLRRACRALSLAHLLLDDEPRGLAHLSHYTAGIELSFYALERTCQALLIGSNRMEPSERRHHVAILESSHEAGLWTGDDAARMGELYSSFRTVHYYQRGLSTQDKAIAILSVAEEAHRLANHSAIVNDGSCLCGVQ